MHGLVQCPPGEQVDSSAPELAGTRTSQHKLSGHWLLDQGMDHVQEFRDALHRLHDDRGLLGRPQHELTESLRASAHLAVDVWLQQIDKEGLRKQVPQPGRLTCAARSEYEEAVLGDGQKSPVKFHFAPQSGNSDSRMRSLAGNVKSTEL